MLVQMWRERQHDTHCQSSEHVKRLRRRRGHADVVDDLTLLIEPQGARHFSTSEQATRLIDKIRALAPRVSMAHVAARGPCISDQKWPSLQITKEPQRPEAHS